MPVLTASTGIIPQEMPEDVSIGLHSGRSVEEIDRNGEVEDILNFHRHMNYCVLYTTACPLPT